MKRYTLRSRGLVHHLEQINGHTYVLRPAYDSLRIIYAEDNENIDAVDPDDGPFMSIGDDLSKWVIERMQHKYIKRFRHSKKYQGFLIITQREKL